MNPVLKNIMAVVVGVLIGSIVNMAIVMISGSIIPPPEGGDITTMEGLKETIHLFAPKHFIFPFLAHALGTLSGAFIAAKVAANRKMTFALVIGVFFFIGGAISVYTIGGPLWFNLLDLLVAYIPMAYLGGRLATKKKNHKQSLA